MKRRYSKWFEHSFSAHHLLANELQAKSDIRMVGLLLVGEPGTAKSLLSELLSAAISGSSICIIQGTAGTTEDQIK